jgi:hypothetical protein
MNYGVLGEMIAITLVSLSVLVVAVGFSVRVFLGPVIRDVAQHLQRDAGSERAAAAMRMELMEDRLEGLERGMERLEESRSFDRQLGVPSGD